MARGVKMSRIMMEWPERVVLCVYLCVCMCACICVCVCVICGSIPQ